MCAATANVRPVAAAGRGYADGHGPPNRDRRPGEGVHARLEAVRLWPTSPAILRPPPRPSLSRESVTSTARVRAFDRLLLPRIRPAELTDSRGPRRWGCRRGRYRPAAHVSAHRREGS